MLQVVNPDAHLPNAVSFPSTEKEAKDRDIEREGPGTGQEPHVDGDLFPDNWVEERPGELFLDLLQQPPEGCKPGDVGPLGGAGAASEQAEDLALPGDDDGAGVALSARGGGTGLPDRG